MKIYKKWKNIFTPLCTASYSAFPSFCFHIIAVATLQQWNQILSELSFVFSCNFYLYEVFWLQFSYIVVWMLLKNCKLSFVKIQYDKPRSKRISNHCDPLCFHNRPQIALCNDLLLHNVPFLDTNNARFIRFYIDFSIINILNASKFQFMKEEFNSWRSVNNCPGNFSSWRMKSVIWNIKKAKLCCMNYLCVYYILGLLHTCSILIHCH